MAGGSITRALLLPDQKQPDDNGESSNNSHEGVVREGPSTITLKLVFSTIIIVCGSYTYGTVSGYTSPAESGILSDLGLSVAEYSVFGSIMTIGGVLGAAVSGTIADVAGRRGAMWVFSLICIIGWLTILFSEGAWSLDLGRLLLGFGIGIVTYLGPLYLAEIAPNNLRGALTSIDMLMAGSGVSITYIIGSLVNWRTLALICAIPCMLQFLGLFLIPESPRWLGKNGQEKKLEDSLEYLRGKKVDISQEAADIKDYVASLQEISDGGFWELFQRRYARPVIVAVGLRVLQQCGGFSGYVFYMSSIFESAGFSSSVGAVAVTISQIVMNITSILIIDRVGRRPLMMVCAAGTCLGSLLTGLSFLLQDYHWLQEVSPFLALIGVMIYIAFIAVGLGTLTWVIISEVIPFNIKGSVGSLANFVGWSASWLISYTFNFLFEWSSAGVFFIYASISGVGIIFVAKLVPETKGRTLEEIQASLTTQESL